MKKVFGRSGRADGRAQGEVEARDERREGRERWMRERVVTTSLA